MDAIGAGNLIFAVFNLLPAFAMDCGRILRPFVGLYKSEDDAARIASAAGRYLAVAMGRYGLLSMNFLRSCCDRQVVDARDSGSCGDAG